MATVLCIWTGCRQENTLFVKLDNKKIGVDFNNDITEYDTLSILNSEFIYNGGGVGIGDLNGDGLQDLYFTGNQVDNKLYLNKGNLQFEEVTTQANAQKYPGQWSSGINMIDINRDGKLDIYICNTFINDPTKRKNLLFINQGNNDQKIPQFKEMAAEYGIADTTHSSNAQFFDYDNDGDLDLFIAVNYMDTKYPNQYFPKVTDGSSPNRDRLYRNDWDETAGHPVFTDVSDNAGIKLDGYSHSALITDFNDDGWLDIYVANDYITNDLIYINNQDGTFTNHVAAIFKHQAASAMGSDVSDVNNDGRLDFFTTEMMPYYNKRKKLFLNANNYNNYINNEKYGYEYQYARNTLQINQGNDPGTGLPIFSEVAFLGNVQETEWSWTPLLADFDNDGKRDLFVTNGFPRDVTDHDFGAYRSNYSYLVAPLDLQAQIPQIKVPKFAFKNEGDLRFSDASKAWGVDVPAFTNGAAYGDLDNDGDLDLVLNNIDDPAFIFKNTLNDHKKNTANYIRIKLIGDPKNPDAIGAKVTAYFNGESQSAQVLSARGYISTSENIIHFGLGSATKVDSLVITLPGNKKVKVNNIVVNQLNEIKLENINTSVIANNSDALFDVVNPAQLGLAYIHRDTDYIDFNFQKTLPHKFSHYGPSIAVGDVNGDGLEDAYLSGSAMSEGTWLLQNKAGNFTQKPVTYKIDPDKKEEELGSLLFDADNDGDLDLYLVHGGNQYDVGVSYYQDVLYVNDGKGNFTFAPNALPKETACGQVVKAADFEGDGDLDLFVGGRVLPHAYPKTDQSFILRNDSKSKDNPVFTNITEQVLPELREIGMVSDALWTDFNKDNQPDLIVAGEWMPLTFLQNVGGKFKNITSQTGIGDKLGWWTSLAGGDFDNDGDIDYIAGNFGENIYFQCNNEQPLRLYAKDFDKNGLYDPFLSCYWQDSLGNRQEYFYHTRDDMIKQLVLIRRKFQTYGAFGEATVADVFSKEELQDAQILQSNWLKTSLVENLGNGKFNVIALPTAAQLAPIYGILPYDVDADGLLDIMLVGNDFGMELLQGRADAFNGLVLKNTGKNQFKPLGINESHFFVPQDARALTSLRLGNGQQLILATQNRGELKIFSPKLLNTKAVAAQISEVKAQLTLNNGQKRLQELYWGHTFLSQASRQILLNNNVIEIEFFDNKNVLTRKIKGNEALSSAK
ncbi:MAG: VCBS repeat-containing protein [Saprospiraceae bacterium]